MTLMRLITIKYFYRLTALKSMYANIHELQFNTKPHIYDIGSPLSFSGRN